MKNSETQLCLGTAKFGDPNYGHGSSVDFDAPEMLLTTANECHITWLDTSPRYGDSEQKIGAVSAKNANFNISSKIDSLNLAEPKLLGVMQDSVKKSLNALKKDRLDLVYLHQNNLDILQDPRISEGLRSIKDDRLAASVGASVYSLEEIDAVLENDVFDWIQISGNILDISNINYVRLHAPKMKIAVRSIYLQGLILNPTQIGPHIPEYKQLKYTIKELEELTKMDGLDIEKASISFMVNEIKPEMVIFGTNVATHIKQFYNATQLDLSRSLSKNLKTLAHNRKNWTNPKLWKIL